MRQSLILLLATVASAAAFAQQASDGDQKRRGFADVLELSGVTADEFDIFSDWDGELTEQQAALTSQLLFRLKRWPIADSGIAAPPDIGMLSYEEASEQVGRLVTAAGTVEAVDTWPAAGESHPEAQLPKFACTLRIDGKNARCLIVSPHVPRDWISGAKIKAPFENVRASGVLLAANQQELPTYLLLAERLQWRPADHPQPGVAWLASRGFDASMLDDVQHNRPFAKPDAGRENEAFYQCLAIMRSSSLSEVASQARRALKSQLPSWQIEADRAEQRWQRLLEDGQAADEQIADARQEALLLDAVVEQAAKQRTSVAPLFLTPQEATGQFVVIEGVARRAVRVARQRASELERRSPGAGDYYEVDVFTPDSQNLPIVCCAARLPEGFPEGEVIREPVRVAGVFFKKWAYQTRRAGDQGNETGAAPLVIAPSVALLASYAPNEPSRTFAIWAGIAFIAVLAVIWIVVWRSDRGDRVARRAVTPEDVHFDELP